MKVAVHIGTTFTCPTMEQLAHTLKYVLENNQEQCQARMIFGENCDQDEIGNLHGFMHYITSQAEKAMSVEPGNVYAASIMQILLQVSASKKRTVDQRVIFIAARNKQGHEWVYTHVVGEQVVSPTVIDTICDAVNHVLQERRTLAEDLPENEFEEAANFIFLLTEGVTSALEEATIPKILNS